MSLCALAESFLYLAGIYNSPGEFFWIWYDNISTNQRGHMTKIAFYPCPDDNLRHVLSIDLKFSKYHRNIKIKATLNFESIALKNGRVIND